MFLIIALFIILCLCMLIRPDTLVSNVVDDRVLVEAYDGRSYRVRNTSRKQETALALARVNEKAVNFINRLVQEGDPEHKGAVMRLKSRYRPDRLSEGRIDRRYSSYTINKGEEMVLCMRSRDEKDNLYDDNLVFYVVLHELAHVASVTEDHREEFHVNFRYLLRKASEWGLFTKQTHRFDYCGVDVNGM